MKSFKLNTLYVGLIIFVVFTVNTSIIAQSILLSDEVYFNENIYFPGLKININNAEENIDFLYQNTFDVSEELKVENVKNYFY